MYQSETMAGGPAFRGDAGAPTASIDGIDLVGRCCAWQQAWKPAQIAFPAALLAFREPAKWVRNQVRNEIACVGVRNEHELALAIAAGIHPVRVLFHCDNAVTRTVWHAVGLGVQCVVVNAESQLLTLSACAPQRQCVLVDVTDGPGLLAGVVATAERLELIGLHCQLDKTAPTDDIDGLVGQMAQFFRDHGRILGHLSLALREPASGSPEALRALAEAVNDVIDACCRRLGFPRPAVTVSPHWQTRARRA